MGNLVRKPTEILINTVDSSVIAENAANTGVFLKDYGELLSAKARWNGTPKDVLKVTTRTGEVSKEVINIKAACAVAPVQASVNLRKRPRLAGQVGMTQNVTMLGKDYDGNVNALSGDCSGGFIPAADNTLLATGIVDLAQKELFPFFKIGKTKVVDVTDRTSAIQLDLLVDGAGTTAYDANTMALVVAAINAGSQAYAWSVDGAGVTGTIYIVSRTNADITTAGHDNCADSTTYKDAIGIISDDPKYKVDAYIRDIDGSRLSQDEGSYPYLTTEDMFRIFPVLSQDHGSIPETPVQNVSYSLYRFELIHEAFALDGANHLDQFKERLDVYVAHVSTNIATFEAALKAGGFLVNGSGTPLYNTAVFTFATDSTQGGSVFLSIDDFEMSIDVATGQTPTQIAAAVKAAVDTVDGLSAAVDTGEVTITKAAGITECTVSETLGDTTVTAVTLSQV